MTRWTYSAGTVTAHPGGSAAAHPTTHPKETCPGR